MPTLLVIQGPDKGLRRTVAEGKPAPLGRASPEMPLTDYTVSRKHAELRPSGRSWAIEDLKSANGTYLNGKRLERSVRLKHGDQIRLGATLIIFDSSDDQAFGARPGRAATADLVDLHAPLDAVEAAVIASVGAGDDSMILATPAAAEAVRSWRVMSALLDAVGALLSPRQLVERVLDIVFEEVPSERGYILMRDSASKRLEFEALRWPEGLREQVRATRPIADRVVANKEGVLCSNAQSDARFGVRGGPADIAAIGLQSVICVPLVTREVVMGVIYVDCPMARHIYTEEQLRLVAAIGQMAGLAIEDARLVNERVRTERLAAAGETVAALSHYIKNILQGLTGGSDLVEMGLSRQTIPLVDQGWQIVQRNLDKIYSLTMNMLAYAKQREPRWEPMQINALVDDALKLVARRAEDKGVAVKFAPGDAIPAIPMDEHGIHQVVLNVVANAIDAVSKNTGIINIATSFDVAEDRATITIADNGPGIPAEVRERIFDAFYSTKGHGGTGLGLAVAKKIMDEHLGRISVDSVDNEGTIIRISLPAKLKQGVDSAETHGPFQG